MYCIILLAIVVRFNDESKELILTLCLNLLVQGTYLESRKAVRFFLHDFDKAIVSFYYGLNHKQLRDSTCVHYMYCSRLLCCLNLPSVMLPYVTNSVELRRHSNKES